MRGKSASNVAQSATLRCADSTRSLVPELEDVCTSSMVTPRSVDPEGVAGMLVSTGCPQAGRLARSRFSVAVARLAAPWASAFAPLSVDARAVSLACLEPRPSTPGRALGTPSLGLLIAPEPCATRYRTKNDDHKLPKTCCII